MAIASWAAVNSDPATLVWITLDDYDNRPEVFWSYVVAALRRVGIATPRLRSIAGRGTVVDHVFLLRLASVLAAHDPPVVLILDDVHLLTEQATLDGLAYVLRNATPGMRLVAASRMDPLLPLHRYRLAGELTEIRADDLAFTVPESALLMEQQGITLPEDALDRIVGRTEGWAAGIRLAAISLVGHPDPWQFVKELDAEESAVTSYLVDEVLNAQPAGLRMLLLRTSILDSVSADIATELSDAAPGAAGFPTLARTNAFVRPIGHGWYRYHSLFAAVLRLKLRREYPGQAVELHRRAAKWYQQHGLLSEAVRHAGKSGDWCFAARMAVDELAIGQLIEPPGNRSLAAEFRRMPGDVTWTQPQPLLVAAAIELSGTEGVPSGTALRAAERILERLPADDEIPARLAAALIRLTLSRRTGDQDAAAGAAARARALLATLPDHALARHPGIHAQVLGGYAATQLWAGQVDAATITLHDALSAAAGAADAAQERADCRGLLALAEALRGRLSSAAELASEPAGGDGGELAAVPSPAAHVALAQAELSRGELKRARGQLKLASAGLRARPDMLVHALACLVAAHGGLAEGRPRVTADMAGRARLGWSVPAWLEHRLAIVESRACAAAGDADAAIDWAGRADPETRLDAAAALAHAWLAAGNTRAARRALASGPAGSARAPDEVRLAAWLADARLSYCTGDRSRGRRSLGHALRLARTEQLRLPFVLEQGWLRPVLRRDPELAQGYRQLLGADLLSRGPAGQPSAAEAVPLIVEQLSDREREVLQHLSAMLSTAEIAAEMYISVNTVKTHLKSIYRKLAAAHRNEAVRRARLLELL
jgi:LuxR family maltose regulon positive regulatory protein